MDSITHALYRAINTEHAYQRRLADQTPGEAPTTKGLVPMTVRPGTWEGYAGAEGTDMHIALTPGDEVFCLFLEFTAAGFCPPVGLVSEGADVIISPGRVELNVSTDRGDATWVAVLEKLNPPHRSDRRGGWSEQTI